MLRSDGQKLVVSVFWNHHRQLINVMYTPEGEMDGFVVEPKEDIIDGEEDREVVG